jgi:hypothetical protein
MVRWEETIQQPGLGAGDFLPALPSARELQCGRKTPKVLGLNNQSTSFWILRMRAGGCVLADEMV